jgi:sec-independent protein translocase protein TatB
MPSFQDSIVIFFIALLIFGPKKLPELARQLGKLMAEFRRASNEFRMQMEDELRIAEQADQQKKIAAMEAAAPTQPTPDGENSIAPPREDGCYDEPLERHPHELPPEEFPNEYPNASKEPLPIATSGDLNLMPPYTGLPVANTSVSQAFDSIPRDPDPEVLVESAATPDTAALSQHAFPVEPSAETAEAAASESAAEALHG